MSRSNDVRQKIIDAFQPVFGGSLVFDDKGHIRKSTGAAVERGEIVLGEDEVRALQSLIEQSNQEVLETISNDIEKHNLDNPKSDVDMGWQSALFEVQQDVLERIAELQQPEETEGSDE